MRLIIFITLCLFTSRFANAQARIFEPGQISNGKVFGPTFTKGGARIFFVDSQGGRDTLSIKTSVRGSTGWSVAQPVSFSRKGAWKDIDPFVTPDQSMLIFNSNRNDAGTGSTGNMDVWVAPMHNDGTLGEPYRLAPEVNTDAPEYFATAASNGNLYFTSIRENDKGKSNIYVSEYVDGKYRPAYPLPTPINSEHDESNPYISPNEDFLIFVKMGHQGGYGDSDLYISFKHPGGWTSPQNLGPEVNTEYAEFCPYYDSDTGILYFGRIARGTRLIENIYFVPVNVDALRNKQGRQ
jgi:hypothetical protein